MGDRLFNLRTHVVEDQTLVRQALAFLIQSAEGLEIVGTASTVEDAEQCQPQLVLLSLPAEQNIFERVREFQHSNPAVKIVLLDDSPQDFNVREALRLNVAGYLTKQQPFSQIASALRRVGHGERVFAPEIARRLTLSADGLHLSVEKTDDPLSTLTRRETDVLVRLAQGDSVKQCAKLLGIGTNTVSNHRARLMKKLDVHKTVELTRLAIRNGLITDGGPSHFPGRPW